MTNYLGLDVGQRSAPPSARPGKVLIVEGDAAARNSLMLFLQALGHRTIAAADGAEAFALTGTRKGSTGHRHR